MEQQNFFIFSIYFNRIFECEFSSKYVKFIGLPTKFTSVEHGNSKLRFNIKKKGSEDSDADMTDMIL